MSARKIDPLIRFWAKVEKTDGCWTWTAGRNGHGYGLFTPEHHVQVKAHRYAWELLRGPIPEGLVIDHLCRNRACVNPSHLEPVTAVENVLRGISQPSVNARRQACAFGHQYSQILSGPRAGKRFCRECHNEARRQRRAAKRESV